MNDSCVLLIEGSPGNIGQVSSGIRNSTDNVSNDILVRKFASVVRIEISDDCLLVLVTDINLELL